jgi:hypothetical protein
MKQWIIFLFSWRLLVRLATVSGVTFQTGPVRFSFNFAF